MFNLILKLHSPVGIQKVEQLAQEIDFKKDNLNISKELLKENKVKTENSKKFTIKPFWCLDDVNEVPVCCRRN